MLFSPNSRQFGLEIDTDAVRAVQLRQGLFGVTIEGVNELPLDKSPWLKNGLRDHKGLSERIEYLIRTAKPHPIRNRQVVVSLPESLVFSKIIQLPKIPTKELAQTIPFEAADFLPLPIEEMYLDWQTELVQHTQHAHTPLHVFIVAAPKQLIDELTSLINGLNLQLMAIESQPFTLARALSGHLSPHQVTGLIHIGQKLTTITLTTASAIKMTATTPIGSLHLRQHMSKHLPDIADEINEAIQYYHNRLNEKEKIAGLLLTGPGATQPHLADRLSKLTRVPVNIGYPPLHLPDNKSIHPRFTTVFGLALRK